MTIDYRDNMVTNCGYRLITSDTCQDCLVTDTALHISLLQGPDMVAFAYPGDCQHGHMGYT